MPPRALFFVATLLIASFQAPQSVAQELGRANERIANAAVHIYRAEACGHRSRAWAKRAKEWATLMLGNIDMDNPRDLSEKIIIKRSLREKHLARFYYHARIA